METKKTLTISEIRELDKRAIEKHGIPGYQLMENAGSSVTDYICSKYPAEQYPGAVVICGTGNNGGDGFVIARQLKNLYNYQVKVLILGSISKISGDPLHHFENIYHDLEITFIDESAATEQVKELIINADILVDAIYGTGLKGELTGLSRELVELINDSKAKTVSVDIPTGIHGDRGVTSATFVKATDTITFVSAKKAMAKQPQLFGELTVADIGIPLN